MGKMIIKSRTPGVLGSAEIVTYNPQIVNGYWHNKESNQPIKAAYLGQTVVFRVETKDVRSQNTLTLRLYDLNKDQFNGDTHRALVQSNKAEVEFELSPSWLYRLIKKQRSLKLYWEVTYEGGNIPTQKLPSSEKDYLTVMPRLLYVAPSKADNRLPDMYTRSGERFSINEAAGAIKGVLNDQISNAIDKSYRYLLVKLGGTKVNVGKFDKVAGSKIIGALKAHAEVLDVVDVINSGGKSVSNLPLPITGPLAPLTIVAHMVVNDFVSELQSMDREIELRMMEAAKQKGLNHVRDFVKRNDPGYEKYRFLHISPEVVIKILKGEYYTINNISEDIKVYQNTNIIAFCRKTQLADKEAYIIESFYWDGI